MRERPIIFNSEMVKAILDGRKTMTRRPLKLQPYYDESLDGEGWIWEGLHHQTEVDLKQLIELSGLCPHGQPGDRLWVREIFALANDYEIDRVLNPGGIFYKATHSEYDESVKWRPSIHMPRWASRITLEVTGVRVERLLDIHDLDAEKEGVLEWEKNNADRMNPPDTYKELFLLMWNLLYAKKPEYQWEANPWVWVIEFKKKGDEKR